jgi:C1A family cysteine protease
MKAIILLVCLVGFAASSSVLQEQEYQALFTKWMVQHNKNYDIESFFGRYNLWKENLDYIHHSNQQNKSYTLAMNKFGDLTTDEFRSMYNGAKHGSHSIRTTHVHKGLKSVTTDGSYDWVSQGYVTGVKDQQQCGSCWSFSTTGALEFLTAKNGQLTPLSEQCLMDCDTDRGNSGCNGGWVWRGYEWVHTNGIASEAAYPYTAMGGTCQPFSSVLTNVGTWTQVPTFNEDAMMSAIGGQTLSILLAGDHKPFQYYSGGVLDTDAGDCGTDLDHAVLLVGYGTDGSLGKQYWTVKNSWGSSWGENGYIRIVRGSNLCNLSANPTYPNLA